MAAITQPTVPNTRPQDQRSFLEIWGPRILIYLVLGSTSLIMLFPFIYMVTTSLKTATDVFRSPPRLLPFTPINAFYEGQELPLYEVTMEDGSVVQMVNTGQNERYGFFTTPDLINVDTPRDSAITVRVPLDSATDTGTTQDVGGEAFDVYSVPMEDGSTQELLLAFRGGLSRLVDPNNPEIVAFENPLALPTVERIEFRWSNYEAVLTLRNLDRSLVNTTIVTFAVTFGQVVTSLLGGYAFSRMKFRGQTAVFLVYLGTIMIPFVVLIIPLYQIMVLIGWQDRLVALIVPWIFTAYGTFLMRQFFMSIPKDLEEAATLDGLSRLGILMRVFVPLSGPAIATQSIITFLYAWNSFVWPLIIIGDSPIENHVLTLSLITLRNAAASEPNIVLTGAAVAILPPLILFVLAQRYFIEGIANTGLK
ncbi:MAG: carbohydrate ABC transporter permease [Pleurocapsa minor GSE-CHR-MK-17-07R]|jgi:multiple sugar transport system permease protein|nr:carbohydrate ABC transporter permease [Pleurocapsa minor GSE-CHR-MK 17-07R]